MNDNRLLFIYLYGHQTYSEQNLDELGDEVLAATKLIFRWLSDGLLRLNQ